MKLFEKISSSISFDLLVREQRKLISEIRQLQESISEAKTNAEKMHLTRDSASAQSKLNALKPKFEALGLAFYGAEDVVKEMGLRAKLESDDISREQARQIREEMRPLKDKKIEAERGIAKSNRSWGVFQLRYWGLTGRAVKWITSLSGGALFMKGWRGFYDTGITAQRMQLETVGKLDDGVVSWGEKAASFSLIKSEVEGTLKAYSISGVDIDDLTKRLISYSGASRNRAEELFSSLASTARIASMDFKDVWDYTEKRARRYNRDLVDVAKELHEIVAIADGTEAEVLRQDKESGETKTTRGVFRKEYLQAILSVTSEIEEKSGYSNQVAVAKLFSSGVVEANRLKSSIATTLTTAKAYTKFLHLDDVYNYQLAINVVARIDAEVEKKARGQSALQADRITHEVIFDLTGKELGTNMELMYRTAKEGGFFSVAPDIGKLWSQTSEGSTEATKINYEAVSKGTSDYGIQLLVSAGMSREEAITAVVAVKAGHMNSLTPVQKKLLVEHGYEDVTSDNSQSYQKTITEGAKNVFGSITSGITQVWGSPLVKMAAGLGVMAYAFRKEIVDSFRITRSWASLATSYLKWAGLDKLNIAKRSLASVLTKGNVKKAGVVAGLTTLGVVGLSYGMGKLAQSEGGEKEESPKDQAKKMVPSTSLGTELGDYITREKGANPEKIAEIVGRDEGTSRETERITGRVVLSEAVSREKAMKRSAVEAMGGTLVQRGGRDVAEVRFPKFIADAIPGQA